MKYLRELLAALVFAALYFAIDQYWLHKDRAVGRNMRAAGVAVVCYFVLTPLVRKWMRRGKANVPVE